MRLKFEDGGYLNFDLLQFAWCRGLSVCSPAPANHRCPRPNELLHRRWEADLIKLCLMHISVSFSRYIVWGSPFMNICEVVGYRDDVLLVDNWFVKSQQSDVILEGGGVVRLVDCLASDLVVLVRQPLALVAHVPFTEANLKFRQCGLF